MIFIYFKFSVSAETNGQREELKGANELLTIKLF